LENYKLMYKIKTNKFKGPLDLLLQLIEKNKLEITEISLAEVTEQYLENLAELKKHEVEDLADFLVVAARLLLLKSKALLPFLQSEEEEVDDLQKQLKMYKEFVQASEKIRDILARKNFAYSREKLPVKTEVDFSPPEKMEIKQLKHSFLLVLKRLDPIVKMPRQMMEKSISLQQTIFDIKNNLKKKKALNFQSMISKAQNKTEVIVNFLALLELMKQKQLYLKQKNNFNDITIKKI